MHAAYKYWSERGDESDQNQQLNCICIQRKLKLKENCIDTTKMASVSILIALFAIAVTMTHGSPLSRRDIWSGGTLERQTKHKCYDLPEDIACYCPHNRTILSLPNSRHTTFAEVQTEFKHYRQLLTANPCSDYIGALLCFEYFPFPFDTDCTSDVAIRPCRSTCELAKTEACTSGVKSLAGGWAPHLDCEKFPQAQPCAANVSKSIIRIDFDSCTNSKPKTKPEIEISTENTTDTVTTKTPTEVEESSKEKSVETEAISTERPTEVEESSKEKSVETEAATTEKPTEEESTEAPTKKVLQCSLSKQCSTRTKFNKKTFTADRNKDMSFAIRGTNVNKVPDSESLYEVTVEKALSLETCINGAIVPAVNLTSGSTVTIASCYDLSSSSNGEVLIAGTHTGTQEEGYEFTVGCKKSTGLVASWKDDADTAVEKGNKSRRDSC